MKIIGYEEESREIIYEQIDADTVPLKLVTITFNGNEEYCQVLKHWHRSLEIIIPEIGGTSTWIEGETVNVNAGEMLVVNSKLIHSCRGIVPYQKYLGYALQIKYDFMHQVISDIDDISFDAIIKDDQQLKELIDEIISVWQRKEQYDDIRSYSLAYELLYQLMTRHSHKKSLTLQSEKQKNRLAEILLYIDEHSDEIINVNDIAKHFHLSYGYLAGMFQRYLHQTIKEYLNYERIKKIEKDLLTTDLSVTEISLKHGFTNTKSFYREFNKYHEMSPKEFRKR